MNMLGVRALIPEGWKKLKVGVSRWVVRFDSFNAFPSVHAQNLHSKYSTPSVAQLIGAQIEVGRADILFPVIISSV